MKKYTTQQLKDIGFETENKELTIVGDWVGTSDDGTIDMTVEYLFYPYSTEGDVWEIDPDQYAISARVLAIGFWDGDGEPPFEVGEVFDTLDEIKFEDCL